MGGSCFSKSSAEENDEREGLLRASSDGEKETVSSESEDSNLRTFTLAELEADFNADSLLGEGRLGPVYKGKLRNTNKDVAIRRLNPVGPQRHDEFLTEAKTISELDHPNIVKLIGHCVDGEERLLVYEYMPLGSLESHLFSFSMKPLDWNTRMGIALCIAKGLKYLHIEQDPPIVHRNLKCSNVLLGEKYIAKLSDIGLAEKGMSSSGAKKNYEYHVPEYPEMGKLTVESDVYGFGLLLLEVITGRRAHGNSSSSTKMQSLVAWAQPFLNNEERVTQMADLSMNDYKESEFRKAAYLAAECLQEDASRRPKVDEIICSLTHTCYKAWEKQHADEISGSGSRRLSSAK